MGYQEINSRTIDKWIEDMTKPLPFDDESFDIIFHPVSDLYEDTNGIGYLHELNIFTFLASYTVKR